MFLSARLRDCADNLDRVQPQDHDSIKALDAAKNALNDAAAHIEEEGRGSRRLEARYTSARNRLEEIGKLSLRAAENLSNGKTAEGQWID